MPVYVNNNYFSEQNANMAYIMGFLAADGNVSKNGNRIQSQLSIKDKSHLEKIQAEIGGCEVYEYLSNGYKSCGWHCYSAQIKNDLISYGIIPNKTGTLSMPKNLKKIYWKDFIRGYFDGDGSIHKDGSGFRVDITCANQELLDDINSFFVENNIKSSNIMKDHNNVYIRYRSQASIDIYNLLYYDNCLCLDRKKNKFLELMKEKYNSTRLRNFPKEVEKIC
jgi:DNA-binding transcriptional regulator WhiA